MVIDEQALSELDAEQLRQVSQRLLAELRHQRLVQPVQRREAGDILLGRAGGQHHGDGIAGNDPDHEEDDHGDTGQRYGGGQKPRQEGS